MRSGVLEDDSCAFPPSAAHVPCSTLDWGKGCGSVVPCLAALAPPSALVKGPFLVASLEPPFLQHEEK